MKKIFLLTSLVLLVLASCTKDNEDNPVKEITAADVVGTWYQEIAKSGTIQHIDDGSVTTEYDHIGLRIDLYEEGSGNWVLYYIKDGELVNFDGFFYSGFDYTVKPNGCIFLSFLDDVDDGDLPGFANLASVGTHVTGMKDDIRLTLSRTTSDQKVMLDRWDSIISYYHMGSNEGPNTPITNDPAGEPSNARRH